ncbi:histone-like nucleoid-structuring protein Lsr2 [Brachybacterium tyrofermentans]|uniref:histone-like nucleoid-structuring protein Lsr2 n=1 Tax=Brachybacterium tyrofermentans TaxID=47848 RepID=UPI003FCFF445
MARKTQVILTDDIDGTEATGTVSFAIDGVAYEIDLNDNNAQQMREQLSEWTSKARRVGGRRNTGTRTASSPSDAGKIREWAKQNGHDVPERGRISKEIREAYNAAH